MQAIVATGYESLGLGFATTSLLLIAVARSLPVVIAFSWLFFPAILAGGLIRVLDLFGTPLLAETTRIAWIGLALLLWIVVARTWEGPQNTHDARPKVHASVHQGGTRVVVTKVLTVLAGLATGIMGASWADLVALHVFRWLAVTQHGWITHASLTGAGLVIVAVGIPLVYERLYMKAWWFAIACAWCLTEGYAWIMQAQIAQRELTSTTMLDVLGRLLTLLLQLAVAVAVPKCWRRWCGQSDGYAQVGTREKTSIVQLHDPVGRGNDVEHFVIEDPEDGIDVLGPVPGDNPFANGTTAA